MRDQLRAVLIALVIAVYGVAASPLPKGVKRSQFETAMAKEELDRWVGILGGVGVTTTRKDLADFSWEWGQSLSQVRSALLGPFRPWFRVSGTGQGWGLFTYPDTFPHQLTVDVRVNGEWKRVYAGLDDEADWMRDTLVYRRVRGVYDGNTRKPGASYTNFANWIGRRALEDFPEATEARVGFLRFHTLAPGEAPDPERTEKYQRVVTR